MNNTNRPLSLFALAISFAAGGAIFASSSAQARKDPPVQADHAQNAVMRSMTAQTASGGGKVTIYTVPAGKILVIESIFGRAMGSGDQSAYGFFKVTCKGSIPDGYVAFERQGSILNRTHLTFNHAVKWYCDPGTKVEFNVAYKNAVPYASYTAGFSGYLVDK